MMWLRSDPSKAIYKVIRTSLPSFPPSYIFINTSFVTKMRIKHISIFSSIVNWAAAAPVGDNVLQERETVNLNGCWCCNVVVHTQPDYRGQSRKIANYPSSSRTGCVNWASKSHADILLKYTVMKLHNLASLTEALFKVILIFCLLLHFPLHQTLGSLIDGVDDEWDLAISRGLHIFKIIAGHLIWT